MNFVLRLSGIWCSTLSLVIKRRCFGVFEDREEVEQTRQLSRTSVQNDAHVLGNGPQKQTRFQGGECSEGVTFQIIKMLKGVLRPTDVVYENTGRGVANESPEEYN